MSQRVVIIGASDKPDRYAYKAFEKLRESGHTALPVSPRLKELNGVRVFAEVKDVPAPIDTITMYVGPEHSAKMADALVAAAPRRVIFNPGSENEDLALVLRRAGIATEEACTLVLLASRQF